VNQSKRGDVEAAFELISEFKAGRFGSGSDVSARQLQLLKLLRADLLPNETALDADLGHLILRVADEDTRWNHRTMDVIDAIYSLRSDGKPEEADSLQQKFLRECPSQWYRDIVDAV
jgi:hypothetical protein